MKSSEVLFFQWGSKCNYQSSHEATQNIHITLMQRDRPAMSAFSVFPASVSINMVKYLLSGGSYDDAENTQYAKLSFEMTYLMPTRIMVYN